MQKSGILKTDINNTRYKHLSLSCDKNNKQYLLPLVIKGQTIYNEEDKIQERLKQERLKQRKKELLLSEKKLMIGKKICVIKKLKKN